MFCLFQGACKLEFKSSSTKALRTVVVGVHNFTRKAADASISLKACAELELRLGQICRCLLGGGS